MPVFETHLSDGSPYYTCDLYCASQYARVAARRARAQGRPDITAGETDRIDDIHEWYVDTLDRDCGDMECAYCSARLMCDQCDNHGAPYCDFCEEAGHETCREACGNCGGWLDSDDCCESCDRDEADAPGCPVCSEDHEADNTWCRSDDRVEGEDALSIVCSLPTDYAGVIDTGEPAVGALTRIEVVQSPAGRNVIEVGDMQVVPRLGLVVERGDGVRMQVSRSATGSPIWVRTEREVTELPRPVPVDTLQWDGSHWTVLTPDGTQQARDLRHYTDTDGVLWRLFDTPSVPYDRIPPLERYSSPLVWVRVDQIERLFNMQTV